MHKVSACVIFSNSTTNKTCSTPLDIILVIDASDKIDKNEFDTFKLKLAQSLRLFNASTDDFNIALMTYSDKIKLAVPLSKPVNSDTLASKVTQLEQDKNSNLLPRALHYAQSFILKSLKVNLNRKKVVVLFTDGVFSNNEMKLIRKEANLLKMSAELMAIQVGKNPSKNNLKMIVSCSDNLVEFDNFYKSIQSIATNSC